MKRYCQSCGKSIGKSYAGKLYIFPAGEEEWHCDRCVSEFYRNNPRDGWAGIAIALVDARGRAFDIDIVTGKLF